MLRLGSASKGMLGVDIGVSAVKLVELRMARGAMRLCGHGVAALPRGAVSDGRIHDTDGVVEALQRVRRQAGTRAQCASVAVPAEAAIIKSLSFPVGLTEDELEAHLQLESDQHIPFPFSEVSFDFQLLGASADDPEQQAVLLVACRREAVEQRAQLLRRAGLKPVAVDVETFAVERSMARVMGRTGAPDDAGEPAALVDIGSELSSFQVLQHGRTLYRHEMTLGSRALLEEVQVHGGGVAPEAASGPHGILSDDDHGRLLVPFVEDLAQQIDRALQLYHTAGQRREVNHLWLAGGASVLPGLVERLAEATGMRLALADPLHDVGWPPDVDEAALAGMAPGLLTACGLAMRGRA
ncbi:type IV pilus assembly protein PilM [Halomonas halmophila]|uniref:type IV pilus assembly protein PilM n=1 Tax=Halomonas halmophila TaxID=252 RepID=UPI001143165D|nr:type IV pilus assembly protein PilM [Halomonas halmophila]